jgi:ABC-type transporter Mla MlaB component
MALQTPAAKGPAGDSPLALDATLEIGQVGNAHGRLLAFLDGGGTAVDVTRISAIDSAGVQLLLALRREAEQRGIALEFRGRSAALAAALALLGLGESLPMAGEHAR